MKKRFNIFAFLYVSFVPLSIIATNNFLGSFNSDTSQNSIIDNKQWKMQMGKDGFLWQIFEEFGYKGAKNMKGDSILIPSYYYNIEYKDGYFIAETKNRQYTIYLRTGELLLQDNIIQIKKDDNFQNSPFIIYTNRNTSYALSCDGKIIVPEDHYSNIFLDGVYDNWFISLEKDGYMGIIDNQGKVVIPFYKYNLITRNGSKSRGYSYSFRIYGDNVVSGVCDETGKELIRTNYVYTFMEINYKGEKKFKIVIGTDAYELDSKGNPFNGPKIPQQSYGEFSLNNIRYQTIILPNGKTGAKRYGETILPCEFDLIGPVEKYIFARKGNYYGVYNADGRCIIQPTKYTHISAMKSYFRAELNGKSTCVDLTGKEMSPFDALRIRPMINGKDTLLIKTSEDNFKCALYSLTNKQIIPYSYDNYNFIKDDETGDILAYYVFVNNTVGVCDLNGKEIIEPIYSDISVIGKGKEKFFQVVSGEKVGIFDMRGAMIITPEVFDDIVLSNKKFIASGYDRKCTFNLNGKIISDSRPSVERDNFIRMADNEFDKSNWNKAADYYGKALSYYEDATLYFNRGISYYNNKKYTLAIEDLKSCISLSPSQSLFDKSRAYIAKARELQAEKVERRQSIASNILGLVLGVASTVASSYYQSNHPTGTIGSNLRRDTNMDYLLNPAYAMQQVQHENWREYMTATDGGKNMSYEEWYALKAQAWSEVDKKESMNSSSSSSSSSSTKAISIASNSSSICSICRSTGICRTCDGHGYYYNMFDGRQKLLCPNCYNHNGKCSSCGGSGRR